MPDTRTGAFDFGIISASFERLRLSGSSNQEIFVELYHELKVLAQRMIGRAPAGPSMHATRLISDLYLRLFGRSAHEFEWISGEHFFYTVTRAMHQLLIDHARHRKADRRGGGRVESLDDLDTEIAQSLFRASFGTFTENAFEERAIQALDIDRALARLRDERPRLEKVLLLTYYGGLSRDEVAMVLGLSGETIKKDLLKGRARVRFYLDESPAD